MSRARTFRTDQVFDPSIKGETDRFAYPFVKSYTTGADFMSVSHFSGQPPTDKTYCHA